MGPNSHRIFDLAAAACFIGLVALPVWFAVCAVGPKLGLADGGFALETMTYRWGLIAAGVFLLIALIAVAAMVFRHRSEREWPKGSWVVAGALAVSVAALGVGGWSAARHARQPDVSEVTTDAENPPVFTEALVRRRGVTANPVTEAGAFADDAVVVRVRFEGAEPDEVFDALIDVARDARWRVGSTSRRRGLVELTVESFWYSQTDDFVVRITPDGQGGSWLDYRASARFGSRDGGRNARRLIQLERLIRARLA